MLGIKLSMRLLALHVDRGNRKHSRPPEDSGQRKVRVHAHVVHLGGLSLLAHADRDHIVRARGSCVGDVQLKRSCTTHVGSYAVAVPPDFSAAVHAVKGNPNPAASPVGRYLHMLAISTLALFSLI